MATFYLINTAAFGTPCVKFLPGTLVNDAIDPIAAIAAVGGILWPSADATVAAAAVVAQKAMRRGANENELSDIMQAGAAASLSATKANIAKVAATALTDAATQTLASPSGVWGSLPTLSQGGALTLGTTGAKAGDTFDFTRTSVAAFAYAIINGGAGAGTLITYAASKLGSGVFQFDGTNWALKQLGVQ